MSFKPGIKEHFSLSFPGVPTSVPPAVDANEEALAMVGVGGAWVALDKWGAPVSSV